jgi:hypothetical protein
MAVDGFGLRSGPFERHASIKPPALPQNTRSIGIKKQKRKRESNDRQSETAVTWMPFPSVSSATDRGRLCSINVRQAFGLAGVNILTELAPLP